MAIDPDWREHATRIIWIVFGIIQAVVSMLMAFGVITTTTVSSVVTAVALVLYVAANELLSKRSRRPRLAHRDEPAALEEANGNG